ncbi:MAG: urate hydroxylase PuuD [Actinomycetota bacterium]|nr:urate hydroxylase PuuD [Actinomycetota bacterium]
MDPYLTDWLNLLVRWLHVVAAIAWIGTSFYFVYLDLSLLPPRKREDAEKGVGGEFWSVHGGGFYHVQKYRVAPDILPEPLHWFKWEAYTTWLSGFALFIVLYYANADTQLVDPRVADLGSTTAIAISVGLLALAWVVYDLLCRLLAKNELLLGAAVVLVAVAAAYTAANVFSGRAAYIQVGAMLGTMMAGNVLFNIIPAHRELVAAKEAGREPDPTPGIRAKQRSVHNNYLTLPVVFAMLANHVPLAYGHEHGWLVLVAIMAVGAWIRHFFNLRHRGRTVWAIPASAAVALVALALALEPDRGETGAQSGGDEEPVEFAEVERIVNERCAVCHSVTPTEAETAPKGITFDTREEIAAQADAIRQQAIDSRAMPPGNVTGMTDAERDVLAEWIRAGAKVR